jgi:uncharacterized protein (DUF433 family)
MSAEPSTIAAQIVATPGTCGGAARIDGTRIRVSQIVLMTEQGMSVDEIVRSLPHLNLAQVYAALAYYHSHRLEIDGEIRAADEQFAQLKQQHAGPR